MKLQSNQHVSVTFMERAEIFCQHIMLLESQSDAYRAAYPSSTKWLPSTVHSRASEFSKHRKVVGRLEELKADSHKRYEVTRERVIEELSKVAFLDPRKFYDEVGNLLPVHKLPQDVAAAISGLEVEKSRKDGKQTITTAKIRLASKEGALDKLGKSLDMWGTKAALEPVASGANAIATLLAKAVENTSGVGPNDEK